MNLAIEYLIRSKTARDCFQVPCSLFLNHLESHTKRLIITINWHPFSKKYLVKKWYLDNYHSADLLPPFTESSLNHNEIFEDQTTIVPMYELLPFKEQPYKPGIWQRGDGARAMQQETEYSSAIENFLYPPTQKRLRTCWLWATFVKAHKLNMTEAAIYNKVDDQMWMTERQYKSVWRKWLQWKRHLDFDTEIAPELVFFDSYKPKVQEESKEILNNSGHWNPNSFTSLGNAYVYSPQRGRGKKADQLLKRVMLYRNGATSTASHDSYHVTNNSTVSSNPTNNATWYTI